MSRTESPATTPSSRRPDTRTFGIAAIGGVLAYLVGYAITYAAVGQEIANSIAARVLEIATGDPGTWQLVGWVFYNAHFVTVDVPGLFGSTAVNLVSENFSSALFLLPPVVIALAGGLVAVASRTERPGAGAIAGVAVTLGYLPLAVIGVFLVGIDLGDSTAGPTLVPAILLVGFVYPLVFGALGGAVGGVVAGRE